LHAFTTVYWEEIYPLDREPKFGGLGPRHSH